MKIKRIEFKNHKVLGNLVLDFCDNRGKAVDTVIIAGENGTGKSTLLQELFSITSMDPKTEVELSVEKDNGSSIHISYYKRNNTIHVNDNMGINTVPLAPAFKNG